MSSHSRSLKAGFSERNIKRDMDRYDIPWQLLKMREVPKALEVYYAVLLLRNTNNSASCSLNDLLATLGFDSSSKRPTGLKDITHAVDALREAGLFVLAPDFAHMKYKKRDQKHLYAIAEASTFEDVYPFHKFIVYKSDVKKMLSVLHNTPYPNKQSPRWMTALVYSYLYARIFSFKSGVLISSISNIAEELEIEYSRVYYCIKSLVANNLLVLEVEKRRRHNMFFVTSYFTFPWGNPKSRIKTVETMYTIQLCQKLAENH